MKMYRPPALASAIAALALTMSACSGPAAENNADLSVAVSALAASVDPAAELSASYLRSVGAAEGLMRIQPDGSVEPELAMSVTQDDPTTWTVKLDPERTFWSGAPVDAEAVAASLNRAVALNELAKAQLTDVEIEAVDDSTVRLTTPSPRPGLPYSLAHYQLVIHNTEAYGSEAGGADVAAADMTGPYAIDEFRTGRGMVLTANDSWWGGAPGFESVRVTAVADAQARAELAISGQADIVGDFPIERRSELEGSPSEFMSTAAANTVAVYLNPASDQAPALADIRVRQALSSGVDRDSLVGLTVGGLVEPANTWLSTSPALADDTGASSGFDLDGAASLLDEAGWELVDGVRTKDGEPLTLRLLTFGSEKADGEILQAQWGELGVQVEVRDVENTAVSEAISSGDWDMVTQAWTTLGDHGVLIAGQIGPDGSANHANLEPATVPDLLDVAQTATSEQARTAALVAIDDVITDQVPLVPLHPRVVATAVGGIAGFETNPLQYEVLVTGALTPAG